MANYQCPLCRKVMDRDLILFLDHANDHVIDKIKEGHPEWVASDGTCKPCARYYATQLSGERQAMNIGPQQRRLRFAGGVVMLGLSFLIAAAVIRSGRFLPGGFFLFAVLWLGFLGVIEARKKTCFLLGLACTANLDFGHARIQDPEMARKLKKRARRILLQSALWASVVTLVVAIVVA